MRVYELTSKGCESVDCLPQIVFREENVLQNIVGDCELKLEYELENIPFDINLSYFSILLQDIHNNTPCGMLSVHMPVGEDFDTIIYIVRFDEKEFEKIKKIYLTNFPE